MRHTDRRVVLACALAVVLGLLLGGCDRAEVEVRKALPVVKERAEKIVSGEVRLIALPTTAPTWSQAGFDHIIEFEVGGSEAYYNRHFIHPTWPEFASGITIGIGYDLRFNSPTVIRSDWSPYLPKDTIDRLVTVSGRQGSKALAATLKDISIPWDAAVEVYQKTTIPRFWSKTRKTYPGVDELLANAEWAMLGLTFNRGESMGTPGKSSWNFRRHLRALKPLVAAKDYPGMAGNLRAQAPLWKSTTVERGLARRRNAEADLVESCGGKPLSQWIRSVPAEKRWNIYPVLTASTNEGRDGYDLTFEIRGGFLF